MRLKADLDWLAQLKSRVRDKEQTIKVRAASASDTAIDRLGFVSTADNDDAAVMCA